MNAHLHRGILNYEQNRLDLAEQELRQALLDDPHDPTAHAFLALCLVERERFNEATEEARLAIHVGPYSSTAHFALAFVLQNGNHLTEAKAAIQEAIRLLPEHAPYWGQLASIEMSRRDWSAALAAAESGLEQDPENDHCTNYRARALVKLGRRDDASAAIAASLSRNPDNAATHANMGWTLLHARDPRRALEHFREALRLEPNLEHARAGIVEAMKARNPIYRYLLMYFLWMSRLSRRAQWGVIIGLVFGRRLLAGLAESFPPIRPYVLPILILYVVFMLLTWVGEPLFNMLLRFNRFGRLALSKDQIRSANCFACFAGIGLGSLGWYFWTGSTVILLLAIVATAMSVPVAQIWKRPQGWPRRWLAVYTLVLGIAGATAVTAAFLAKPGADGIAGSVFSIALALFAGGWVLFGWVANSLAMLRVRR